MYMNDYINQGYRVYKLADFPISHFVKQMTNLARKYRLEILVIDDIVYIKDTNKYDNKNPYLK